MSWGWTVGKHVLVMLVLISTFSFVATLILFIGKFYYYAYGTIENVTSGAKGVLFPHFQTWTKAMFEWLRAVITNPYGVAFLIFLSVIILAFEARWR